MEQVELLYGSDTIVDQTVAIRARKLTSGEHSTTQALGEALFRYNTDSDIGARKQKAASAMNQKFGTIRLGEVISFNFDKLDSGQISINVDENAGKNAAAIPPEAEAIAATGFYIGPDKRVEQQRIEAAAKKLEADLNRYLKYEGTIQFLRGNAPRPNYVLAWDQNRYNEIFAKRPRGQGQ
jgi:hypothetical protein